MPEEFFAGFTEANACDDRLRRGKPSSTGDGHAARFSIALIHRDFVCRRAATPLMNAIELKKNRWLQIEF
jgi:hypothetical protein